jgi:bacterioferritin (cytochrome b1)
LLASSAIRTIHFYSFLVFGYNRIPIVSWLREQAAESLTHSQAAGEMITNLGAYPSLEIGKLLDSHQHDIGTILVESLETTRCGFPASPGRRNTSAQSSAAYQRRRRDDSITMMHGNSHFIILKTCGIIALPAR